MKRSRSLAGRALGENSPEAGGLDPADDEVNRSHERVPVPRDVQRGDASPIAANVKVTETVSPAMAEVEPDLPGRQRPAQGSRSSRPSRCRANRGASAGWTGPSAGHGHPPNWVAW